MQTVFETKPESSRDLIAGLNRIVDADPSPSDFIDDEHRADLMFRAGQRELINSLMRAYKLEDGRGIPDT